VNVLARQARFNLKQGLKRPPKLVEGRAAAVFIGYTDAEFGGVAYIQ
jgi:hypothetical protein